MVTFVETASVFWGQVLNADIVDSTNKLDNDLQEVCLLVLRDGQEGLQLLFFKEAPRPNVRYGWK